MLKLFKLQVKIDYSINAIRTGEPERYSYKYGIYYRKNIFHKWHQYANFHNLEEAKRAAICFKRNYENILPIYV